MVGNVNDPQIFVKLTSYSRRRRRRGLREGGHRRDPRQSRFLDELSCGHARAFPGGYLGLQDFMHI